MNGKGSKPRPVNQKRFQENWDAINWDFDPKVTEADMIESIDIHSRNSKKQFDALPSKSKQRALNVIKKTQHVADATEAERKRQRDQDATAPESTVAGMAAALRVLLDGYKGNRK